MPLFCRVGTQKLACLVSLGIYRSLQCFWPPAPTLCKLV